MARRLKETENAASVVAVAMPEGTARTVPAVVEDNRPSFMKREWKPYTTSDELPPAKFVTKKRSRTFIRGGIAQMEEYDETVFVSPGEGRYKISSAGELIKVYRKRGGTGTKLIHLFKVFASESAEAKERNVLNKKFRAYLKSQGIPGA